VGGFGGFGGGFVGGEGEGVESVDFGDMVLFGRFVVGIFVVHW